VSAAETLRKAARQMRDDTRAGMTTPPALFDALADWLDAFAGCLWGDVTTADIDEDGYPDTRAALAVARAYLGGEA
jgi:hypothetical protein